MRSANDCQPCADGSRIIKGLVVEKAVGRER
jgi:hypothetical protein